MENQKHTLSVAWEAGKFGSLCRGGRELLAEKQKSLFALRLRHMDGSDCWLRSEAGKCVSATEKDGVTTARYEGFEKDVSVTVILTQTDDGCRWNIGVENRTELALESVDFPGVTMAGPLADNGGDAKVLWPYNEGVLVSDGQRKDYMIDPEYPSCGNYAMFPNMVFAQFMLYLFGNGGLYMGYEDAARGPKTQDFASQADGIVFRNRIFCGGDFGASWKCGFDVVWRFFDGDWMDGAALYREWFTANLPEGLTETKDNKNLPAWYGDMPLVVTYPVRGIHDMDKMDPNGFFPYSNALPYLEDIAEKTGSKLLVLLMHWEGTAPWAPPYVWPPYGGEDVFGSFRDALHEKGHLLGVYCSGLGWTEQSNLIESYNTEALFHANHYEKAMCLAPDQSLPKSRICTGQRSGYDLCPVSDMAQNILTEALTPLFASGVDYIQAMDQNHGGGMYFCYGRDHGHAPTPGPWMTDAMTGTLRRWKAAYPDGLLGCESAAAEPFLPSLGLSDNRYELNYAFGRPVPVYGYLYHQYLYNFMGNQVCCPFEDGTTELCYRMAYAASAGDLLTLVLDDKGEIRFYWGMRDFSRQSDKASLLRFCGSWRQWQIARPGYLQRGCMIHPLPYDCTKISLRLAHREPYVEKSVMSSAWQDENGRRGQFFLNYTDAAVECTVNLAGTDGAVLHTTPEESLSLGGENAVITVPAYSTILVEWNA